LSTRGGGGGEGGVEKFWWGRPGVVSEGGYELERVIYSDTTADHPQKESGACPLETKNWYLRHASYGTYTASERMGRGKTKEIRRLKSSKMNYYKQ
jgi:hypothetical protein